MPEEPDSRGAALTRSFAARLERLEARISPPKSDALEVHIFGLAGGAGWGCREIVTILPGEAGIAKRPGCGASCGAA